jgi:hypothetical protein
MRTDDQESVTEVDYSGFAAVVYGNRKIQITILPEVGAKVVSLLDIDLHREWLTVATTPVRRLDTLTEEWQEYDRSGWDECFPSIAAGYYPIAPWAGTPLRDHGELWHRPWTWDASNGGVATRIHGLRFPYEFTRHLRLNGRKLELTYTVRNLSELPFLCMWSMHPLFDAHPGMKILLASGCQMVVDSALEDHGQARYRERLLWPWLSDSRAGSEDLSVLRAPPEGHALKLFSEAHEVARCALCDGVTGAWLGFEIDPQTVPHCGIWLNEGHWPAGNESLFHVALEPTTGFSDNLAVAASLGSGLSIPGHGVREWRLSMVFGSVGEEAATFVDLGKA